MARKIKLIVGIVLMACLFLPLSTCSRAPLKFERIEGKQLQHVEYKNYVVTLGETRVVPYLFALPFVLPLILAVAGFFGVGASLWKELLNILSAIAVIGMVAFHWFVAKLALGGYFAGIAAIGVIVLSISGIRQWMAERRLRSG